MFASQRKNLGFKMEEGQQVVAQGTVDVYERDGKYQLYARSITLDGKGRPLSQIRTAEERAGGDGDVRRLLQAAHSQIRKTRWRGDGRHRAAIRDIMNISARRNPYVQLILYPALVQGTEAKVQHREGIQTLDRMGIGRDHRGQRRRFHRDLWAFNGNGGAGDF